MNNFNRYKASANDKKKEKKANHHISFVVIAYTVIFAYLLILIYVSITKEELNFIYAEPGEIYDEGNFHGLVIKDETIVYASQSGPIKYFVPEGSKVRQNTYVCAVNQDEETEEIIETQINSHLSQLNEVVNMSINDYEILQNKIREYALDKHSNTTKLVYTTKDILQSTIIDISQTVYINDQELYNNIQQQIAVNQAQREDNGTYYNMVKSGVVGYTFDGFESASVEELEYQLLTQDIKEIDVLKTTSVKPDDPIFKIIDNHKFHIVVETGPYANKYLQDKYDNGGRYNTLYFPKKQIQIDAKIYDLKFENDKYYAVFEIDRYFDEFFDDRFVDFIIKYNDYTGIKIPNESVTSKDLIKVPNSAIYEEKGELKVQKQIYSKEDITHTELISVTIKVYFRDDDFAYINSVDEEITINKSDKILRTEDEDKRISSSEFFEIQESVAIEGVYVLNKGYSDFRRIITVYEDETFRIIESGVGYSVGLYDKVASDASEILEFSTIN